MSIINKILQFVLALAVIAMVFALTLTSTLSSSQKLTSVLDQSGFYQALSSGLSSQLKNQVTGNGTDSALVKKSIDSAVTPELVAGLMQPTQIAFVGWLNQTSSSLDIKIDLSTTKDKIASKADTAGVRFEIAKILPDSLELTTQSSNSASSSLSSLEKFKYFYQMLLKAIPILWATIAGSAMLLFLLNLTKGSKKLTRIFMAMTMAGLFGLAIGLASKLFFNYFKINQFDSFSVVDSALILRLLVAIVADTAITFGIIAGIGFAGSIVSKIFFKSRDHKIKHGKK